MNACFVFLGFRQTINETRFETMHRMVVINEKGLQQKIVKIFRFKSTKLRKCMQISGITIYLCKFVKRGL